MAFYHVYYKDSFRTHLYFDNYKDAKRNYDEAVGDDETQEARMEECGFIDGMLAPINTIEHYKKKNK